MLNKLAETIFIFFDDYNIPYEFAFIILFAFLINSIRKDFKRWDKLGDERKLLDYVTIAVMALFTYIYIVRFLIYF